MDIATRLRQWGERTETQNHDDAIAAAREIEKLRAALTDMLSGWKYIRANHGDLYGVGWDRAQSKAEKALGRKD